MTKQINGDKLFVINPHPAIPPADQLKKWEDKWFDEEEHTDVLLIQAFQAGADQQLKLDAEQIAKAYQKGADQELEACCEWLGDIAYRQSLHLNGSHLRAARRPKPPSLAKRALHILGTHGDLSCAEHDTVRRALEPLDD